LPHTHELHMLLPAPYGAGLPTRELHMLLPAPYGAGLTHPWRT
jgi:hypothetical protein